jgi:Flp pilus assembly pilin Flp
MTSPFLSPPAVTRRLWLQRAGQNMVEYALLAGFLAVVGAGTLALAGDQIKVILRRLLARTRRSQG